MEQSVQQLNFTSIRRKMTVGERTQTSVTELDDMPIPAPWMAGRRGTGTRRITMDAWKPAGSVSNITTGAGQVRQAMPISATRMLTVDGGEGKVTGMGMPATPTR